MNNGSPSGRWERRDLHQRAQFEAALLADFASGLGGAMQEICASGSCLVGRN